MCGGQRERGKGDGVCGGDRWRRKISKRRGERKVEWGRRRGERVRKEGEQPSESVASAPGPLFIFGFERAWYAKIRHVTSLSTSVGVSMETPPFTMTSFQSAYGQVAV